MAEKKKRASKGPIRLQKFLSHAGIASRRKAETMIQAGRVTVNGKPVTEMGTKVWPDRDLVTVDGETVTRPRSRPYAYYVLNKPTGTICTEHDPQGRKKVIDLLPDDLRRVFTVGRLDYNTEGVLLFTNNGDLAEALMRPENAITRVYHVKIQGPPDEKIVERFDRGVRLDDGRYTRPVPTQLLRVTRTNSWYELVLTQGRNRQVHRMFATLRRDVLKLKRVQYGPVTVDGMELGAFRKLTNNEVADLMRDAGMSRQN